MGVRLLSLISRRLFQPLRLTTPVRTIITLLCFGSQKFKISPIALFRFLRFLMVGSGGVAFIGRRTFSSMIRSVYTYYTCFFALAFCSVLTEIQHVGLVRTKKAYGS